MPRFIDVRERGIKAAEAQRRVRLCAGDDKHGMIAQRFRAHGSKTLRPHPNRTSTSTILSMKRSHQGIGLSSFLAQDRDREDREEGQDSESTRNPPQKNLEKASSRGSRRDKQRLCHDQHHRKTYHGPHTGSPEIRHSKCAHSIGNRDARRLGSGMPEGC